jgi:hypothetical protein
MIYLVKAENICTTYIGNSFREADEVYNKCKVSATMFTRNETGKLVPVLGKTKEIRSPNPAFKLAFGF